MPLFINSVFLSFQQRYGVSSVEYIAHDSFDKNSSKKINKEESIIQYNVFPHQNYRLTECIFVALIIYGFKDSRLNRTEV